MDDAPARKRHQTAVSNNVEEDGTDKMHSMCTRRKEISGYQAARYSHQRHREGRNGNEADLTTTT